MIKLIVRLAINAVAIWAAASVVSGVTFDTSQWGGIVLVALVFGVVNVLLKPLLTLIGLPLIVLTFGLFSLVINAILLQVTDMLTTALTVDGFWPAVLGALVVSLVSWFLELFLGPDDEAQGDAAE
jgi:putative membrane protein